MIVAGAGVAISGDMQGKIMTEQQPMKMAAAEAQYETKQPASFSIFTIGSLSGDEEVFSIRIPHLLSFLATGDFNGEVEGVNPLREQYEETYGQDPGAAYYTAGDYVPYIPVTYWSFRLMIGLGLAAAAIGLLLLWVTRKGRSPTHRVWLWAAIALPLLPVAGNSFGWIFTEMGRQPWVVFGLMTTEHGVSPGCLDDRGVDLDHRFDRALPRTDRRRGRSDAAGDPQGCRCLRGATRSEVRRRPRPRPATGLRVLRGLTWNSRLSGSS